MQLPAQFGRYELQEFLGGGMSHVYRAKDTVLGRTVAVKILTEQGCSDSEAKARFLQEAKVASQLDHDNIMKVYDFGEQGGKPFIVMEFLRGENLRDAIRSGRIGNLQSRLTFAVQIAKALDYIHQKKIIHRDIKPENLQIDHTGKIKLMDFGIAKTEGMQLTRAGFTLGTPYYMAPEQVLGQRVTHLADVYSFGILLFEMLCGNKPILGESIEKIFNKILYEPLDMGPLQQAGVAPDVQRVVAKCTAKQPQERFPTLFDAAVELERFLGIAPSPRMDTVSIRVPGAGGAQPQPQMQTHPAPTPTSARPTGYGQTSPMQHGYGQTGPQQRPGTSQQSSWAQPTPTGSVTRPTMNATARQATDGLPGFVRMLPGPLQNQGGVMLIVALAVLLFMGAVFYVISLVVT